MEIGSIYIMDKLVHVLIGIACIYILYTVISLVIKVRKAERENCTFDMPLMQIVVRMIGVFVLIAATYVYWKKEFEAGVFFFLMTCSYIIDFIDRSITIKKR